MTMTNGMEMNTQGTENATVQTTEAASNQQLLEMMNLPANYGERLTPAMREKVQSLAASINITDRDFVTNYGSEQQTTLGKFADTMLAGHGVKEFGEAGDLLKQAMNQISGYDSVIGGEKKGFFGIKIGNPKKRVKQIMDNYKTVDKQIELIVNQLVDKKTSVSKVYDDFESLYEANKQTYTLLTTFIYAGEIALERAEQQLQIMKQDVTADPQEIRDFADNVNRWCIRLSNLKKTRYVAITLAPQIRSVQKSADQITDAVQTLINTSIPVWKTELAVALGIRTIQNTADIVNQANDLTNQLLLNVSEAGRDLAIESAKAAQRGVLDIETARKVNQNIIQSITESTKITTEGIQKIKQDGKELRELETSLANAIREVR